MRTFLARQRTINGKSEYSTAIDCDTIDGAIEDLAYLDHPVALYAIDTEALTIRDVSQHAAMLLACRVCDGRISLSNTIREFVELYSRPGSLLPAAA